MSSSNSPCAACKFLRRKCTQGCVFAPYFPPDQPQKFAHVHRVFGASNVAKLLNELSPSQREDAVNSLAYEAEARLRDPVYGCVGYISILQHKLKQVQHDLYNAKKELSAYIGPAALGPFLPLAGQPFIGPHHPQLHPQQHLHHQAAGAAPLPPFGVVPGVGMGMGLGLATGGASQILLREQQQQQHQHQHQQIAEAQLALAAAAREQEIMRSYEQQQNELTRLNSGFDGRGRSGFNQVAASIVVPTAPASGVALVPAQPFDNLFNLQQQQQHFQEQPPLHHHKAGSDEGKSVLG